MRAQKPTQSDVAYIEQQITSAMRKLRDAQDYIEFHMPEKERECLTRRQIHNETWSAMNMVESRLRTAARQI